MLQVIVGFFHIAIVAVLAGDGAVLKLATISKVKNNGNTVYTWNTSVPSGFTKAWKDNDNEYTSLTGFWAANKLGKNQGWVAAVTRGHNNSLDNKHIHVIFKLNNGYSLLYQDVRKFGKMSHKKEDELYDTNPLNELGVDPILDTNIDNELIHSKIINKRIPIMSIFLEQSIITGLGNIYVDEVLFSAKIDPNRPGNIITLEESNNIIRYSKEILEKAILNKGTTIRSYTSSLGVEGNYQNFLNVHTKNICPHCKNALNRVKINGRTTYYCNNCQR